MLFYEKKLIHYVLSRIWFARDAYIPFVPVPWPGPKAETSRTDCTLQVKAPMRTQPHSEATDRRKAGMDLRARRAFQAGAIVSSAFALQYPQQMLRMRISSCPARCTERAHGGQGGKH